MIKYLKSHKLVIIISVFFILVLVVAFFIQETFFSNKSNAIYGDRLKGIEKVKLTKNNKSDIIAALEEDSAVQKTSVSLQGKIINVIITVNDDVGVDTSKSLAGKILEKLSDGQKEFYDVQVFVKKNSDATDFPIIGYKHSSKDGFAWTKDRAAS